MSKFLNAIRRYCRDGPDIERDFNLKIFFLKKFLKSYQILYAQCPTHRAESLDVYMPEIREHADTLP